MRPPPPSNFRDVHDERAWEDVAIMTTEHGAIPCVSQECLAYHGGLPGGAFQPHSGEASSEYLISFEIIIIIFIIPYSYRAC